MEALEVGLTPHRGGHTQRRRPLGCCSHPAATLGALLMLPPPRSPAIGAEPWRGGGHCRGDLSVPSLANTYLMLLSVDTALGDVHMLTQSSELPYKVDMLAMAKDT